MFKVVDCTVSDHAKRYALHVVIRDCIKFRNRRLYDSCNMDVIFANLNELKRVFRNGGRWTDKEFQLLDDLFTISGHLGAQSNSKPSSQSVCQSSFHDATELTINAEGFKTIVINMGNGKQVVLRV